MVRKHEMLSMQWPDSRFVETASAKMQHSNGPLKAFLCSRSTVNLQCRKLIMPLYKKFYISGKLKHCPTSWCNWIAVKQKAACANASEELVVGQIILNRCLKRQASALIFWFFLIRTKTPAFSFASVCLLPLYKYIAYIQVSCSFLLHESGSYSYLYIINLTLLLQQLAPHLSQKVFANVVN